MRMLGCLLLLACVSVQAGDEVYKWVDADGSIHYGNNPPKGVNARPVGGDVTVVPALTLPLPPKPLPAAVTPPATATPAAEAAPAAQEPRSGSAASASSASADELKRRRMIDECERNRGSNCEAEVDARLNGATGTVFVPVPGWSRSPIRPSKPEASSSSSAASGPRLAPPRHASSSSSGRREGSKR